MITALIEGIQSGDLNNNQILQMLTNYQAGQVTAEEFNEAITQIEALEGRNTLSELMLQSANKRADEATEALKDIEGSMDQLRASTEKVINNGKAQASEIIRLRAENKTSKANAKDIKALKANKAKMIKKSAEREKRITSLEADNKAYRNEISSKEREISRLRLTGQKTVGEFKFTIFPSKIEATDSGVESKRVGLVAFTTAGTMKVVRANEEGVIIQPKDSEPFDFCEESQQFIRDFCAIARAEGDQFTNTVLKLVN